MRPPSIHRPDGIKQYPGYRNVVVYPVRDVSGELRCYHVRLPEADGDKTFRFLHPNGRKSKNGELPRDAQPLYASELAGESKTLFVTEGEKACDALLTLDIPAVATVTGASGCPKPEAIASLARDRNFIVWPDNDEAGRIHSQNVAVALTKAGAAKVKVIGYDPGTPKSIHFPTHGDAYNFIKAFGDPEDARQMVAALVEGWAVKPSPPQTAPVVITVRAGGSGPIDMDASVSDALAAVYGINAAPNRNVRCPKHHDQHASLHVLPDDKRAVCHATSCIWSGRGVIAVDILGGVA